MIQPILNPYNTPNPTSSTHLGWKASTGKSIDQDNAYDFVFDTIQKGGQQNFRKTSIGKVFDDVLEKIGETTDTIWIKNRCGSIKYTKPIYYYYPETIQSFSTDH